MGLQTACRIFTVEILRLLHTSHRGASKHTALKEKQQIGSLFDRIARRYDLLNHLLSLNVDRRWRRRAVAALSPVEAGQRLLDVATGTADLALEIVRQGKADCVLGVDLSEEMMKIGREKIHQAGRNEQILLQRASALELPFEDDSFATVTCAYGVRNFADLDQGLREMRRVLRPGGQLMILEFSYPDNRLIAWGYDLYFTHILPRVGRLVSHDKTAYSYLNRSVKAFVWGRDMTDRLLAAGLSQAEYKTLSYGITTIYTARK